MRRQSKDRFAIVFGTSLVALTFFLVIDIQTGLNLRRPYLPIPPNYIELNENTTEGEQFSKNTSENEETSERMTKPAHDSQRINDFGTYANLKRNIGWQFEKIGKIRKYLGTKSSPLQYDTLDIFGIPAKDRFIDLQNAVDYFEWKNLHVTKEANDLPTLGQLISAHVNENSTILDKFNYEIKQNELYSEDSKTIDALIHEMATRKISRVEDKIGGTQIKMTMHFDNGDLAVAKPMRFPRDQQTLENTILYADYERHIAEIASFWLDRLLSFRRAFPVTGRCLNVTTEIYEIADTKLRNTFFISLQPYRNQCFYGTCTRYCDISHPICSEGGMLETSLIAYFPVYMGIENTRIRHPWRKSYNPQRQAIWEKDPKYCDKVKTIPPYNKGRRLFDLMDMAIFDFLTGNMDRHHYETFTIFGEEAFTIHYDNGRGFGRPFYDELANLAPLVQCCMIRSSTLKTLLRFQNGPKPLSQLMKESMASDPISKNAPVLLQPHLDALDRRVGIILTTLRNCIETHSIHDVVYPRDEF